MSQNIPEETMKKVELLWTKVGLVVQLSQMVEYNLANILNSPLRLNLIWLLKA